MEKKDAFKNLSGVAKGATRAAEKFNKAAHKAKKILRGKPQEEKAVVSVSEMKSLSLYVIHGSDDKTMYRRKEKGSLEKLSSGKWVEVKVTRQIIMNIKFREY